MKKVKQILNILHSNLSDIDSENLSEGSLYYVDETTGESTKVAEYFGGGAASLIRKLKKGVNEKAVYSTIYQKSIEELMGLLKPNELRILFYFISRMGYENAVFGITYRGVADKLDVSLRTVTASVNSLMEKNLIKMYGNHTKKVYYVNPAVAWKGSRLNIGKKTGMFNPDKKVKNSSSFKREITDEPPSLD